jgi:predicted flap endonuclease-1-like 5' DNA nuclease
MQLLDLKKSAKTDDKQQTAENKTSQPAIRAPDPVVEKKIPERAPPSKPTSQEPAPVPKPDKGGETLHQISGVDEELYKKYLEKLKKYNPALYDKITNWD